MVTTSTPSTRAPTATRTIGKLGVRDRAQLVVVAYQTGLVSPGYLPAA
jgi:hypothetical protein